MQYHVVPIKGKLMLSPIKEQVMTANEIFGWNYDQTLADFNNDYSEYYCMVVEERLIGYIGLHHILDEASINQVFIQPEYRGHHLATELLQFVLEQLHYRQIKHVFLEVRASNLPAIRLYQQANFELLTKRKNYYHAPVEDALIFQKSLSKGAEDEAI